MTEFSFNGVEMDQESFMEALDLAQESMMESESAIRQQYGVSGQTASAIFYLRGRSRWSEEKEKELVDRDRAGNPISLGAVLSGEF